MAAVSWKSAVSANWNTPADWSTGAVPAAADTVTIGVAGAYTVALTTAITVNSIAVSDLHATLAIAAPGITETVTAGFGNAGGVDVDAAGTGGTSLKIGGTLSSSGVLVVGNSGITKASTVTAAGLANTGTIDLTGGTAQATLDVTGGTLANLTGHYILRGDALLEVESSSVSSSGGSITSIAGNAELVLDGAQSRVAQSTATTTNSGLTGLTANAGTLAIQLGSSIAAAGALTNTGLIAVDNDFFDTGDAGGSSLTVGSTLTNKGDLDIGNSGLIKAATVTAAGLSNAAMGTIDLTGGTAQATLDVTGAAAATLTGFYYLQGDALVEFGSGHVTAIATNSELSLDGASSRIALSNATTTNSALTLLASNSGILDLSGSTIATTAAFANRNQLTVDGGSKLTLGGALTNSGDASVDSSILTVGGALTNSGDASVDGGTLTVGGALTNSGDLQIDGTQVTAGALSNTGTIDLSGDAARATFDSTAAAPATLTGNLDLSGNALMEFASGDFTTIAAGASLALDGPRARVALNSNTTTSGALSGLAKNLGAFDLADGAAVAITPALANSGTLSLNSFFFGSDFSDDRGSSLTIGGVLTNTGQINIGNSNILAATAVTAAGLANTGTIDLSGGPATLASLDSTGAAPATWTGTANLSGDALLEYASGAITAIASGAHLSLDGALSRLALSTAATTNSALTKLATNAGTFNLAGGGALTTTVAFGNTGFVDVDASGTGGTHLTLGGALTNSATSTFDIGNSGITAATVATASGLANTGTIDLTGGAAILATLDITTAAPATLTGAYNLNGDALLEYKTGAITALGSGAELSLNGAKALAALSTALTSDSALTGLANNAGTFILENGGSLKTTVGLTNSSGVQVDSGFGGSGGSSLTVGGTLTNMGFFEIGNTSLTKATTVTAAAASNSGSIELSSGTAAAALKVTGAFGNTDFVEIDTGFGGGGGSSLTIGGTLTNSATFEIGNTSLAKATTVTAAGLSNTGMVDLTGSASVPATLDIAAAAPATLGGSFSLAGDALLEFKSGAITALGSGAELSLNGAKALVALSTALTSDSALTGLASNAGTLVLENGAALTTTVGLTNSGSVDVDEVGSGGSSLTIGGTLTNNSFDSIDIGNTSLAKATTVTAAALTNSGFISLTGGTAAAALKVTGAFNNAGSVGIDTGFDDGGGSSLTVGGTLTNSASLNIGNTGLTRATTVTAAGLANTGTIDLTGGTSALAKLDITAAVPATWTATAALSGDAVLEYASGGIIAIGAGGDLSLNGATSLVAMSTALTTDSALTALSSNAGTFSLEGGATLTTTTAFDNTGSLQVDFGGGGGSSLTIGGTLTNSASLLIGASGLGQATTVTVAALSNTGGIQLNNGGTSATTQTLTLTGASSDAGSITINAGGLLHLANTLTVSGTLDLRFGGTVSGGTLATSGSGGIATDSSGTLSDVTIATGSTFTADFSSVLTVNDVTVNGALYGSGSAALDFASTGTDSLTNVSGFTTIGLANGAANTLTFATANFTGTAGVITVNDGNSGNTVSGSTLTSADAIVLHAGAGADVLTGGAGNDVFYAGGDTTMTGGGGTNQFIFSAAGAATNKIADFGASSTNELVFSNSNFGLGLSGASATPQAISSSEAATLFTANSTGAFANTSQRLAYDTANGELFSSTGGSGGTSHLVATLTGEPSINTANQLFFIS